MKYKPIRKPIQRYVLPIVLLTMALAVLPAVNCGGDDVRITARYKNGKKKASVETGEDGTTRRIYWSSLGFLKEIRVYRGEKLLENIFYRRGRKTRHTFYLENKRVKSQWYYTDGSVSDVREYKDGKAHGRWTYWDKRGRRVSDVMYENGIPVNVMVNQVTKKEELK